MSSTSRARSGLTEYFYLEGKKWTLREQKKGINSSNFIQNSVPVVQYRMTSLNMTCVSFMTSTLHGK